LFVPICPGLIRPLLSSCLLRLLSFILVMF
jgi:hypothetical protein